MTTFAVQCDAAVIAERVMGMTPEDVEREATDLAACLPHLVEPVAECLARNKAQQLEDFLDFGGLR